MKKCYLFRAAFSVAAVVSMSLLPSTAVADSDVGIQYDDDSVASVSSSSDSIDTIDFWTQERIDEAIANPAPLFSVSDGIPTVDNLQNAAEKSESSDFEPIPPIIPSQNLLSTYGFVSGYRSPATGKLTYSQGGNLYSCSASFISSDSRRLIATAAHCLYSPEEGQWSTNMMFWPEYGIGQQGFPVSQKRVLKKWQEADIVNGELYPWDIIYDVGIAAIDTNVLPDNLKRPADIYGAHGFGHSNLTGFQARIFGYPTNPGNNEVMLSCSVTVKKDTYFLTPSGPLAFDVLRADTCEIPNPRGASGGPWLQLYDASTGTGWLNGVSSAAEDNGPLYSAVFNGTIYDIYTESVDAGM